MITFSNLGNLGRLGNQMFQYALLIGISKKYNVEISINNKDISLFNIFNIPDKEVKLNNNKNFILKEIFYHFNENIFNLNLDFMHNNNIDFYGYFQSEKYWKDYEVEVRKNFLFKNTISKKFINKIDYLKNFCSIHVRRGDYLKKQDCHPVQSLNYYKNSIKIIKEKYNCDNFLIFSDEIEWCKKNFNFLENEYNIKYSTNTTEGEDLYLMTQCNYHIIANSSFSWWGSYLSSSRLTIAPKLWFGPKLSINHDTKDLYVKDWIII